MQDKSSPRELLIGEWIKKANDDELNASSILTHRDATPGGVCFLSQQMAEKYLKTFLVSQKQWFSKIHPLDTLLEDCIEVDPAFGKLEEDAFFLAIFMFRRAILAIILIFLGQKLKELLNPLFASKSL